MNGRLTVCGMLINMLVDFTLKGVTGRVPCRRSRLDAVRRGGGMRTDRPTGGLLRTEPEQPILK